MVINVDEPCNVARIGPISSYDSFEQEILFAPNVKLFTHQSIPGQYDEPITDDSGRKIIYLCARNGQQPLKEVHPLPREQESIHSEFTKPELDDALATVHRLGKPTYDSSIKDKSEMTLDDGVRELSRILMRHPGQEVQKQLCFFHHMLKKSFNQCNVLIVDNINTITKELIRKNPSQYYGNYIYDKKAKKLYRVLAVDYVNLVDEVSAFKDLEKPFESVCKGRIPEAGQLVTLTYSDVDQLEREAEISGGFHMDNEAIGWMLGGSSEESRGGFGSTADDADKEKAIILLRTFLNTDPIQLSSQALLTKLETIITAIGYRHIHADFAVGPARPNTASQHAMAQFIDKQIMDHKLSSGVWNTYIDRETDALSGTSLEVEKLLNPKSIIETDDAAYLSDASDVEDDVKQRKRSTGKRAYSKHTQIEGSNLSWVGQAKKQEIPVRSHTSSTVTLGAAVIDGLYRLASEGGITWFDQDIHAEQLLAALFIAPYDRGDYHTVAETAAGMDHFLKARRIVDRVLMRDSSAPSSVSLESLTPQQAFNYALDVMILACSEPERSESHVPVTRSTPLSPIELQCVQLIAQWLKTKVSPDNDIHDSKKAVDGDSRKEQLKEAVKRLEDYDWDFCQNLLRLGNTLVLNGRDQNIVTRSQLYKEHDNLIRIAQVMFKIFSTPPPSEEVKKAYHLLLNEVKQIADDQKNPNREQYAFVLTSMENLYKKQLVIAVRKNDLQVAEALLQDGADITEKDDFNETALYIAVSKNQVDMTTLLLKMGANANEQYGKGFVPLHYAAIRGSIEIIKELLLNGAEINQKDHREKTALHYAVFNGQVEAVNVLLGHGADLKMVELKSLESIKPEILELLKSYETGNPTKDYRSQLIEMKDSEPVQNPLNKIL